MSAALAGRLSVLMEVAGLKAPELAERAGLSRSHVYRLLKGEAKRGPAPVTVEALARALGVSPAKLAYGGDS